MTAHRIKAKSFAKRVPDDWPNVVGLGRHRVRHVKTCKVIECERTGTGWHHANAQGRMFRLSYDSLFLNYDYLGEGWE